MNDEIIHPKQSIDLIIFRAKISLESFQKGLIHLQFHFAIYLVCTVCTVCACLHLLNEQQYWYSMIQVINENILIILIVKKNNLMRTLSITFRENILENISAVIQGQYSIPFVFLNLNVLNTFLPTLPAYDSPQIQPAYQVKKQSRL